MLGVLDLDEPVVLGDRSWPRPGLVQRQLAPDDSPYFLRRQKEDLVDEHGAKLFVPRHVLTQPFTLYGGERELYEAVTAYFNEFLGAPPPGSTGGRGYAVALARSVAHGPTP